MPGRDNRELGIHEACIEEIAEDGRGVVTVGEKRYFIDDVLPGERIEFRPAGKRRGKWGGVLEKVLEPSSQRTEPRCPHFGVCGGCSFQHARSEAQVSLKQQRLLDALGRVDVRPAQIAPPVLGKTWGYRHKARLGSKWVSKKDTVLVGFRERRNNHLAILSRCEVLHPSVGRRIRELRELLSSLQARDAIPQIEVAIGGEASVLVFRHTRPLTDGDLELIRGFARTAGLHVYLQSGGPDTVRPLWPSEPVLLSYRLSAFELQFEFDPLEFTQVNPETNARLATRVVDWLKPSPGERVLDLFCGLGNFSLPMARSGAEVVGLEGSDGLVAKARHNATRNQVDNAQFYAVDLTDAAACDYWVSQCWDKVLLDPPRSGAASVIQYLSADTHRHLVYVSCSPASLTRDADILVNQRGYRLASLSVVDMFPHTNHVESVALFRPHSV